MEIDEFCRIAKCSPKRAIALFGRRNPLPVLIIPEVRLDTPSHTDLQLVSMIKIDTANLEDPYYSELVQRCKEFV